MDDNTQISSSPWLKKAALFVLRAGVTLLAFLVAALLGMYVYSEMYLRCEPWQLNKGFEKEVLSGAFAGNKGAERIDVIYIYLFPGNGGDSFTYCDLLEMSPQVILSGTEAKDDFIEALFPPVASYDHSGAWAVASMHVLFADESSRSIAHVRFALQNAGDGIFAVAKGEGGDIVSNRLVEILMEHGLLL